jgi:predicted AlkP superfamily phosphohydrolase/phosphomutase
VPEKSVHKRQRVLVIGLDGATFTVLDPLMKKGYLPNLSSLIENGVHGVLQSTMPPFSAQAWASFMTGKNPGKHGLFDFRAPVSVNPIRPLTNSTFIRSRTIWKLLSDAGKRIGVINVPMTYPPEEVNGFMIGGIMTSGIRDKCFYPADLNKKITDAVGDYRPEPDWDAYRETKGKDADHDAILKLVNEVISISQKRGDAALFLSQEFDWDFFMMVFTTVDRLQHFAWKYLDPEHRQYNPEAAKKYAEPLVNYYSILDKIMGDLIRSAGKDVHVIILSDHGFGPQYKKFFINKWMVEQGLLSLVETKRKWRSYLRKFDVAGIRKIIPSRLSRRVRTSFTVFNCIDWPHTRAYAGTSSEQGIFINLKGREPFGTVSPGGEYQAVVGEVCEQLDRLVEPDTGEKVVSKIFLRDNLYRGPYVEFAPDIIFELMGMSYLTQENIGQRQLFESSGFESGSHRREGILIMKGPHFKKGLRCEDASILDLTPTVLHCLGLPVDEDMDGKVLIECFKEGFMKNHPVKVKKSDADHGDSDKKQIYSDSETREIESMLKGLGYF